MNILSYSILLTLIGSGMDRRPGGLEPDHPAFEAERIQGAAVFQVDSLGLIGSWFSDGQLLVDAWEL